MVGYRESMAAPDGSVIGAGSGNNDIIQYKIRIEIRIFVTIKEGANNPSDLEDTIFDPDQAVCGREQREDDSNSKKQAETGRDIDESTDRRTSWNGDVVVTRNRLNFKQNYRKCHGRFSKLG